MSDLPGPAGQTGGEDEKEGHQAHSQATNAGEQEVPEEAAAFVQRGEALGA